MADLFDRENALNLHPFLAGKPVKLIVKPDGDSCVVQEGNDHSMLIQEITVDGEQVFTHYRAVIPAPVVIDLSAVEPYVKKALGVRPADPLPPIKEAKLSIVDNGKTGAESRSCQVLTVNGVYVELPGGPKRQPIPPSVGCMTGRLYSIARDANVSFERVEEMIEYLFLTNAHVRAMVDGAFYAAVDMCRTFSSVHDAAAGDKEDTDKVLRGLGQPPSNGGTGDEPGTAGDGR